MKFTVERHNWLRGELGKSSLLHPKSGKMCCLGFYALQAGGTVPDIFGINTPRRSGGHFWGTALLKDGNNTKACGHIMAINDNPELSDAEREKRLKEAFAAIGDEIEFVD